MSVMTIPVTAGPGAVAPEMDRWDDDAAVRQLVCRRVIRRTEQISTFVLSADPRTTGRRALPHAAGQYVTVSVEIDGERVSRCYTVSSPATRPYTVELSVKREPGGVVSNWLHDHVGVGDTLEVSGPAGEFSSVFHPGERVLLLAGGVGITPMLSMMQTFADLAEDVDAVLLHHCQRPDHVAFGAELAALALTEPRLRVVQAVDVDPTGTWTGPVGYLDADMLAAHVPDLTDREIFVCGPAPYMDHATELLTSVGVAAERIHMESFVLPAMEDLFDDVPAGVDTGTFQVTFAKSGKTVTIEDGQTVLDAARAAGVRIVTSCVSGLCGTCKTTKLSGEVDIRHNGGIRQREIDQGKLLACCSRPLGPVEVDA